MAMQAISHGKTAGAQPQAALSKQYLPHISRSQATCRTLPPTGREATNGEMPHESRPPLPCGKQPRSELKKTKHTISTHFCATFAAVKNLNLEQQHIKE